MTNELLEELLEAIKSQGDDYIWDVDVELSGVLIKRRSKFIRVYKGGRAHEFEVGFEHTSTHMLGQIMSEV